MEHEGSNHGPISWLLQIPLLPHDPKFIHVNGAILVTLGIAAFSLLSYQGLKGRANDYIVPKSKITLVGFADFVIEALYGMVQSTLGPQTKKYFSFIATLFVFVFISNLMGLLPFANPPTGNFGNTNLALGMTSFVFYNVMGIREHGLKNYLAHFLMGLGPAGVFIAVLEMLSHVLRPFTLSLRLFLNLNMDHLILHTFQGIAPWIVPVPLLLFGIVVCTIQAFVFATLSAVYIQLATEHEHAAEEAHGHH